MKEIYKKMYFKFYRKIKKSRSHTNVTLNEVSEIFLKYYKMLHQIRTGNFEL